MVEKKNVKNLLLHYEILLNLHKALYIKLIHILHLLIKKTALFLGEKGDIGYDGAPGEQG